LVILLDLEDGSEVITGTALTRTSCWEMVSLFALQDRVNLRILLIGEVSLHDGKRGPDQALRSNK
jgi:hypothetical protein